MAKVTVYGGCEGCQAWLPLQGHNPGNIGECRRHAPTTSTPDTSIALWPLTNANDFCLDFAVKHDAF